MTDLERFFRQLVRNLSATDPARLHEPLPLTDLRERIIPYRSNRRALELESSEDYELVLMRLCAGEGGLARTEPGQACADFQAELQGSHPDLELLDRHSAAVLTLDPGSVRRAMNPKPDLAFAPPELAPHHEIDVPFRIEPALEATSGAFGESRCSQCKGELPASRPVNFCPHCGHSQVPTRCPVCESELEAGWRHCVTCGYLVGKG